MAFSDSDGGDPPPPQYEDLEEVRVAVKDDIVPQARMGAEEEMGCCVLLWRTTVNCVVSFWSFCGGFLTWFCCAVYLA